MTSKRTLKFSVLIGAVLLFCFSLFTAFSVKAESYNEAQTGVVIHQNYDISTANGGTYAKYFIDANNKDEFVNEIDNFMYKERGKNYEQSYFRKN